MGFWLALICIAGLLADVWFIRTEYAGDMAKATLLKGIASAFFVLLGLVCFLKVRTSAGQLIFIGLILGLFGDVFLNLRNQFEGAKSRAVFAVGILAFLSGHFLYIAALIRQSASILLLSVILTAVLSVAAIPPLMKRITAPSKGLKIFGYVYLVIVIAMFSCAASLLFRLGAHVTTILFFIGGLLFMVSDFIMIYYSFGKKVRPLRAINLITYYIAQLLIALTILFF